MRSSDGYAGVTVTVAPGAIVKVAKGAQIIIQSGGILNALGANGAPIIFTSLEDDSVGGDTNMDGGSTVPVPGDWNGISVQGSGQFNTNAYTEVLYQETTQIGSLSTSQTWLGSTVYQVTGNIVIPNGMTLTILPGAVVKFDSATGITVQPGAMLVANGTVAQPIYFTSIKDDSIGDTNGDGNATSPAAGDWGSILIQGGNASFNHVLIQYAGGPPSLANLIGAIQTSGSASVTISNSTISQVFFDGILTGYPSGGGVVTVTNSVLTGIEGRAINAFGGSTVHVVSDTFDNNGVGVMAHGGSIGVANSIVANSKGINGWGSIYVGSAFSISYSDVWSSVPGVPNYVGSGDLTGSNGNISNNPVFVNENQGDLRLNYGSPAIDAANGTVAPTTDKMGDPRFNEPLVASKTGVPDASGNYPDMGAYEFVQSANSDIDFAVSSVTGPADAVSGNNVQITYTVTNIGSGSAVGPWHDSVYLVQDPDTNPVALFAGQVLVGSGVTMGPGTSFTNTATIRVPGSTVGNNRWEVKTNTAGDIFEGRNTNNNTGISLAPVAIDLPELISGSAPLTNTFTSAGQSWWYKLNPGTGQTIGVNLGLTGNSGAVQLFVGQGYVPDPQHFDLQQVQWNSPNVSVNIPNTSSQTYYLTAVAQSLVSSQAPFTISAASQSFALTSVSPSAILNIGTADIEFIGAQLTSGASYQLVNQSGTSYTASAWYVEDSSHVNAIFNASAMPTGSYNAVVTENGISVSLQNAVNISAADRKSVV